jgi:hypothetical protein
VPRSELSDPVGDVIVAEVGQVAAEGVGLYGVGAGLEVGAVDAAQHVRPRHIEDLVAAFQAVEIVQRQIRCLQHRAHRAVADQDALGERLAGIASRNGADAMVTRVVVGLTAEKAGRCSTGVTTPDIAGARTLE